MTNQVDGTIILARWFDKHNKPQKVTVQDYLIFVENQDQTQISNFIYHRLYRRYLKPFLFEDKRFKKEFKNGFSIMANCCLLIETLESFKNGWSDSDRKSEQAFIQFFKSETNFFAFKDKEKAFYKNIRCCRIWLMRYNKHQRFLCNHSIHWATAYCIF